jgi:hypothetical protein
MPIGSNRLAIRTGHTHKQTTPATLWTIPHNLGREVVSDANVYVDGVLTKIMPMRVQNVDNNTLELEFSQPFTGTVRVS